uniref:Bacterial Ig-like domain-containing protein n=1 Tax=mine drainage metagenome TaxID=410659 RepID=E6QJ19_9ZZZZ
MPCNANSPDCTVNVSGDTYGVLNGYSATTGFDNATGLGSLNVANVVNAWTSPLGSATAAVAVTLSQSSVTIAQSLTLTVTVSGSSGTPTGTVAVTGGGYTASTGTLASGAYTFTIPSGSLTPSTDTLTVSYGGDSNYALASQTASVTVTRLNSSAALTASPTTVGANTTVALKVAITGGGQTPTGTVSFSGGGATIPSCTLASGTCSTTIPVNALANGNDTITASYSGDSDYNAATATAALTVTILKPTITLTPSTTTVSTTGSMQLKVTITGSGATPTGTVSLSGYGTTFGVNSPTGTLASGSYTFNLPAGSLQGGSDTLTVMYSGDTVYSPTNATTPITVTMSNAVFTITPALSTLATNQNLTVNFTVTSSAGATPGGYINVTYGSMTETIYLYQGKASYLIGAGLLPAGTDTITATYSGDGFYNGSKQSATVSVTQFTKIPATLTVTPASTSVPSTSSLNVAVAVTGSDGTPTGSVTLTVGTYTPTLYLDNAGQASLYIPAGSLPDGTQTITANYSGDPTYLTQTASATVTVVPTVYSLSASAVAALNPGTTAVSTVTVSTSSGYQGNVTLTCALASSPTGATDLPTCLPSNGGLVVLNGAATSATGSVTVSTTATTAQLAPNDLAPRKRRNGSSALEAFGGVALAGLVLLGIPARRRNWRALLGALALLAVMIGGVASCGGSSSASGGTTAGNYTFTVTGTGYPAVIPAPTTTFTVTVN